MKLRKIQDIKKLENVNYNKIKEYIRLIYKDKDYKDSGIDMITTGNVVIIQGKQLPERFYVYTVTRSRLYEVGK